MGRWTSPLGHAIHGLPRDQQVVEQQQDDSWRGDFGAGILGRQMLLEKVVQSHATQQALEDRDRSDSVRDERGTALRVGSSSSRGIVGSSGVMGSRLLSPFVVGSFLGG